MSEWDWRPINTAPKDGRQIVITWKGATPPIFQVVRWIESRQAWCVNYGGWGEDRYREGEEDSPTHWIPTPPAI